MCSQNICNLAVREYETVLCFSIHTTAASARLMGGIGSN
jgi:hypothetical protein